MDMGQEVDDEADDVYNQICGEIGLGVEGAQVGMGGVPGQKVAQQQQEADELDDLESRLAALS